MSKFSTAYDAITSKLSTLFSTKTYIPNVYSLEDNVIGFLRDGYGVRIDDELDVQSQFNFFTTRHAFTVVFTRELVRIESDVDPLHTVIKALKEDVFTLKKELYDSDNLLVPTDVDLIDFQGVSGVTTFLAGNNSFMSIECTLSVMIREQATNC